MGKDSLGLLQGTLDMLILKALAAGPLHGYDIAERIQQLSSEVFKVEEGSLYPALHRMEAQGWLRAEWGVSQNNRRAKYYKLTRRGLRQLEAKANDWALLSQTIARILQTA